MAMSRFAHYLKAILHDKIGSTMSRTQAEQYLNQWIANYVIEDDNAGQAAKAEKPLRQAKIEVMQVPGNAGKLRAVAFLRPHFMLDELTVSLRLVAELPNTKS
jgi:type VI secretion system protein ImpC